MRMISPQALIARGIHIHVPYARVTRSAMLVLPLPGGPCKNKPMPAVIARPTRRNISSPIVRSAKALRRSSGLGRNFCNDCAVTLAE